MIGRHDARPGLVVLTPCFSGGSWAMFRRLLGLAGPRQRAGSLRPPLLVGAGPGSAGSPGAEVRRLPWLDYDRVAHRVEASPFATALFNGPIVAFAIVQLLRALVTGRGDRVISNGPLLGAAAAVVISGLGRPVPLLIWVHADNGLATTRGGTALVGWSVRRGARFVANSDDVAADLRSAGVPAASLMVVPNWVDEPHGGGSDGRAPVLPKYRFRVAYVGRLVEYKHVAAYLAAAERLASPACGWVFVGDGELRSSAESAVRRNPQIHVTGALPNGLTREIVAGSDLVLTYADTTYLSTAAMESLSEGTPIAYVAVSCAAPKYARGVRITRELVPPTIGFPLEPSADSIFEGLRSEIARGPPDDARRDECRRWARNHYSSANAAPLLEACFGEAPSAFDRGVPR